MEWRYSFLGITNGGYMVDLVNQDSEHLKLLSTFHYVVGVLGGLFSCVFIPFGTILGVFTIIVLSRPTVKEVFEQKG